MAMSPRLLRPRATGFNPRSIAGLEAWYAADVASTITIATGVQQWADLSGKARHLIQNVTNNQPLHNSVTLNGKPTVTFDGSNDSLRTAGFTLNQPYSFIMVFRAESNIANARYIDAGTAGVARSGEVFQTLTDADRLGMFAGSAPAHTFPAGSLAAFGIYDFEWNGASSALRLAKNVSTATVNAGTNNGSRLTMAADLNTTPGSVANCSFAELLVFSRILAVTEADKVRQYLGRKYNLAFQA